MESFWTAFPTFLVVGALTTGLDLTTFNLLCARRWPLVGANLVSCSLAMSFSFTVNRRLSFEAIDGASASQFMRFLLITLTSSYGLQNLVLLSWSFLRQPMMAGSGGLTTPGHDQCELHWHRNLAKASAVAVGMVWNYLWYRLWVFPQT
jgi:putative flippase GtrA